MSSCFNNNCILFSWHILCHSLFETTCMNNNIKKLLRELEELDNDPVEIEGNLLKPSQCYHLETNPVHLLFNTNCPESLKQKLLALLTRYVHSYESSP